DSSKNTSSLKLFASVSNDAILIIDYKGRIVSANEATNSLLQTDLAKTQLTLFELLTTESAIDFQRYIDTIISTQLLSTIELSFISSKSNSVNLSVKGVNYTENKCILLCLNQLESFDSIEEQVHDTFFEYSSIAWMFFDKDGKLAYYNKMAKRFVNIITGLELKKTKHFSEYSVKNQAISLESLFEKAYAGEEIRAERNYTIRSYPLILEFHFRPVKKRSQNSGIILTLRNITKEKTEEQLRLKAEADLKKADQKYKGLIEHAFDAIYITRGRHFEYVNKRFIEITGYSEDELTDKNFDFSVTLTDKSKKIVEERYQARQRGEELPSRYHFQIRSKTGIINDVEITTVAIQEENDVVVMGIMRNITEQL
ncbi:MAG: PAS domain S-box protein, partial [Ignavibacteria bacterium]|nr:PAS domain S-box protein [Ignavibacteria bacterium]